MWSTCSTADQPCGQFVPNHCDEEDDGLAQQQQQQSRWSVNVNDNEDDEVEQNTTAEDATTSTCQATTCS